MDKTIYIFAKGKFQDIRVSIREYKGNDLIDIRVWSICQGTDRKVPTTRGICINVNLLPKLKEAIEKVEQELKKG